MYTKRGEGSLTERMHFAHAFFILKEWYIFFASRVFETSVLGAEGIRYDLWLVFFNQGPSVYLGR